MLVENRLGVKSILLGGFLHTLDVWCQVHTVSGVISILSGVKSILFPNINFQDFHTFVLGLNQYLLVVRFKSGILGT